MKLSDILKLISEQSVLEIILIGKKKNGTPYQKVVMSRNDKRKKMDKYIDYEVVAIRSTPISTGFKIIIKK